MIFSEEQPLVDENNNAEENKPTDEVVVDDSPNGTNEANGDLDREKREAEPEHVQEIPQGTFDQPAQTEEITTEEVNSNEVVPEEVIPEEAPPTQETVHENIDHFAEAHNEGLVSANSP